jgi:hypothetical protein
VKLVIFIAFIAALSCEKRESEPLQVLPAPTNNGVEVLSVGSGARLLRYKLAKGTTTQLAIAIELALDTGGRGGALPGLLLDTRIEITDVRPDGLATMRTTIVDAKMVDRPGTTLPLTVVQPMADQLKGLVHTATLAPDGTVTEAKIDTSKVSPTLVPQLDPLNQTLEKLAMKLPSVPVGIGASWIIRKETKQHDVALTTVTTLQLTSIDGDRIGITSQSTLTAPNQTIEGSNKIEVKDIGGGGTMKGTIDLSSVTLVGEMTSEFRGTMSAMGQQAATRVQMKMTFTAPDR